MTAEIYSSPRAEVRVACAADWLLASERDRGVAVVGHTSLAARGLIRHVTTTCKASFGWKPSTLGSLAVSLAMPRLIDAGIATAGSAIVEALSVRVLHRLREEGGLGRLAALGDRPGLARAVARTVLELRMAEVGPSALAGAAPELSRLLAAFEQLLETEKLADRATIMNIAAEECTQRPTGTALLLLDVPVWTALEARLIGSMAASARRTLATVAAGDDRTLERLRNHLAGAVETRDSRSVPGALGRLQASLFSTEPATPEVPGDEVVLLSSPGESRECVEIARRILREAEAGVRFDRMAILLRSPGQYRPHLQEAFRRGHIPAQFSSGAIQPDPAGRAFLSLLACKEEGLSARRFAEYLSLGETPAATPRNEPPPAVGAADRWVPPDEELLPGMLMEDTTDEDQPLPASTLNNAVVAGTLRAPRRWEEILVDAAVIGGRDRWERRLSGYREQLRMNVGELASDDARVDKIFREIAHLDGLRAFALPVLDDLAALPASAPWGDWLEQLSDLATRTLRRPQRVLSVLAELAPMAPVGPVELREVRIVLARRLTNVAVRTPNRSDGRVFVGPIESARGMSFDVVFVPGIAERMFPQRVSQDPLLRDEERRALGNDLGTVVDRLEMERLALRIAVGAASRRVVFSYSRVDVEQARPRVPSFYGLEVLRAVQGQLPSFEALARNAERGAATRLGWPAPEDPSDAIDEAEHDLALLATLVRSSGKATTGAARYLITSNEHLARALRHRALRWDPSRWWYADGLVTLDEKAKAALSAHALAARSYSPTALQHLAACPYRFVLQAIHKLEPREEPIAIERLDPLAKGSLVHEILFELLSELRDRGLTPIRPDSFDEVRTSLERILTSVAGRYKDRLAPAIERVWSDGLDSIRADLLELLRRESEHAEWRPWKLELAFGLAEQQGRDPSSTTDPVGLDCGIKLRGSIDLVEEGSEGRLRATDHKTGKARQGKDTVIGGGESLQPVFYSLALEKLFPDRPIEGGRLSYCTSAGDFKNVPVALDRRARAAADKVSAVIGDFLTRGFMPAYPAKDACRYCDYRPVCGPWEEERTRRKLDRGELTLLKELRNLP